MNEENIIINDDMGIDVITGTPYNGEQIRRAYGSFPWPNDQEINGIESEKDDPQPEPNPTPNPEPDQPTLPTSAIVRTTNGSIGNPIYIDFNLALPEGSTDIKLIMIDNDYHTVLLADNFITSDRISYSSTLQHSINKSYISANVSWMVGTTPFELSVNLPQVE
jgi:hypothetical protein